ncbi:MAG: DUF72 domain-containing protein [Bacteroidota bacterium]
MPQGSTLYRIGLGGWEHDVFDQCLYPRPGMSSAEKLAWYAQYFNTVEIRQTFWDDGLTGKDARVWATAVREFPSFTFIVKLHASFTHAAVIRPDAVRSVRGILQELSQRNRLEALLLQFPYGFTNTSTHRFHIARLAREFAGYPLHVEFRHESWQTSGLNAFLKEHRLCIVGADMPRTRHYMPFVAAGAGDTAYLRLHGRNERGWLLDTYDAKYDYLYNAKETREIARRVAALAPRYDAVTIIANNTTGGKSIPIALQLISALRGGKTVSVPSASLAAFPFLRAIAREEPTDGLPLDETGLRQAM